MDLHQDTQKATVPTRRFFVHRQHTRTAIRGVRADLANGRFFASGTVADISANGFKLCQIPCSFGADKLTYTAIITGLGRSFKILVKPCWKQQENYQCTVGFKIIEAPWEWTEFTDSILQAAVNTEVVGHA